MTDFFDLPESCKINRIIEVEEFLKHAPINDIQKSVIKANTKELRILYNITPEKTGKTPVRSHGTEYTEIQVISLDLHSYRYCKYEFNAFASLFFRAIPYPLILIATYNQSKKHYIRFASSTFHQGKIDISKNIQDSIISSQWIDVNRFYPDDGDLRNNLTLIYKYYDDLYSIYYWWTNVLNDHYSGSDGNYIINCQEEIYRKKEMREYFNELEVKRRKFRLE